MEYFNNNTPAYRTALKRNAIIRYLLKIELLTNGETALGEITKDLNIDVQGQITINYKQLTRRSCSLTVANVEQKYLPNPNGMVWYNRKFKLWIGIMDDHGDIYWWSQGVFYIVSATANAHTVSIEGVDKGGALDGTLKTNIAEVQYILKAGSTMTDIVRDVLALNMGASVSMYNSAAYSGMSMPIDPIPPLIDLTYNDKKIKADISVDANNHLGKLLTDMADNYGADIYYDTNGHLRLSAQADIFLNDGYKYMGHQWDFVNLSAGFADPNYQYSFDGCNCVTVYTSLSSDAQALLNAQEENKQAANAEESQQVENLTDTIDTIDTKKVQNVQYTAYNVNPQSPIRVGAVGLRRMENVEVDYIDTTQTDMQDRCQQYAIMLLHRQTLVGANLSFKCPIIPHLDTNKTIGITDEYQNIQAQTFVIQSINIPLSAGSMDVTATNINWLPSNIEMEGMGEG